MYKSLILSQTLCLCLLSCGQIAKENSPATRVELPSFEPSGMRDLPFFKLEPEAAEREFLRKIREVDEASTDGLPSVQLSGKRAELPLLDLSDAGPHGGIKSAAIHVCRLFAIVALGQLPRLQDWGTEETSLASTLLQFLQRFSRCPGGKFAFGKNAANLAVWNKVAEWAHNEIRRPAVLARMIHVINFGPYAGFPVESKELKSAKLQSSIEFRGGVTIEILRLLGTNAPKEPMILRARKGASTLWSRRMSGQPTLLVPMLKFDDDSPPVRVGPYAWKLTLDGMKRVFVFLSEEGELLFYELDW